MQALRQLTPYIEDTNENKYPPNLLYHFLTHFVKIFIDKFLRRYPMGETINKTIKFYDIIPKATVQYYGD